MKNWKCPVDGYKAENDGEKMVHLTQNANDEKHFRLIERETGKKAHDIKEKGESFLKGIKERAEDVRDKLK